MVLAASTTDNRSDFVTFDPGEGDAITPMTIADFAAGAGDGGAGGILVLYFFLRDLGIATDDAFADGYLRLRQRGGDTLLEFNRDARPGGGWERLIVFTDTAADAFVGRNFATGLMEGSLDPIAPFTKAYGARTPIIGTTDADTLDAARGASWVEGGAGNDTIHGGFGEDRLHGGEGDDQIYESYGKGDRLVGGNGDDRLYLFGRHDPLISSVASLDGGTGNDLFYFEESGGRAFGGAGHDYLTLMRTNDVVADMGADRDLVVVRQPVGNVRVDLGGGNDTIVIARGAGRVEATLGAGSDILVLLGDEGSEGADVSGRIVIDDFGSSDVMALDFVNVTPFLEAAGVTSDDPFADGYLRLVQKGANTLLQFDRDLDGKGLAWLVVFRDTDIAVFDRPGVFLTGDAGLPEGLAAADAAAMML